MATYPKNFKKIKKLHLRRDSNPQSSATLCSQVDTRDLGGRRVIHYATEATLFFKQSFLVSNWLIIICYDINLLVLQ